MAGVRRYELTRLLLTCVVPDGEWDAWFRTVVRAFCGKPPESLLLELERRNATLAAAIAEHRMRRREAELARAWREAAWQNRRDEGNRRALVLREQRELSERFDEVMRPVWAAALDGLVQMRSDQLAALHLGV